jgi:transketolase
MRYEFGKVINEIINKDKKNYILICDIGYKVFDPVWANNPDHILNTGIQEAATIGMASGMAMEGLKPWVYSITPFIMERPFEQIKLDILQQNQNVKLVSYGDYDILGPSHITDIDAICSALKIKLFKPKNSKETRKITLKMSKTIGPETMFLKKDRSKEK